MSDLNIYQRINEVMKEVDYVKKDKAVSGGGANYKAVTHDQAVAVIRAALVKHGIVIQPVQKHGEFLQMRDLNAQPVAIKMGLYSGSYDIHFVNMDKPDERSTVSVEAHANDNGDKAPGKAMTYAVKTAILKQFTLETGEDDESRTESFDVNYISEDQQRQLYNLLCDNNGNYTPKGIKVSQAYRFANLHEIKAKKFDQILKAAS